MKREQIEKGIYRIKEFYAERPDLFNPFGAIFEDENMMKAFIKTMMEFDYEELDYESKKWFIEKDSDYVERIKEADKNIEFCCRYMDKLSEYYDELEQEEEDDEEDTMDNL